MIFLKCGFDWQYLNKSWTFKDVSLEQGHHQKEQYRHSLPFSSQRTSFDNHPQMSGLCWKSWGSAEEFWHVTGANRSKVDALKRVKWKEFQFTCVTSSPKVVLPRPRKEDLNLIFPTRVNVDVSSTQFLQLCRMLPERPIRLLFGITNGVTGCGVGMGGAWVGEEQPGLRLEHIKRNESYHVLVSNRKLAPELLKTAWLRSTSLVHRHPSHHLLCGRPLISRERKHWTDGWWAHSKLCILCRVMRNNTNLSN